MVTLFSYIGQGFKRWRLERERASVTTQLVAEREHLNSLEQQYSNTYNYDLVQSIIQQRVVVAALEDELDGIEGSIAATKTT